MTTTIENTKITQQQINNIAWSACDTFRGVVDPSEYKNYILVFLFLKYISDVWKDHYNSYQLQYGDDEERIRRKLDRERFILPKGASFDEIYAKRDADNIGEIINLALDAIEDANRAKLDGVFRNIDFNSESNLGKTKDRNRRLKNLIEDFGRKELDLRPSKVDQDIIGNTYIYLIERFASDAGKKAGEFFTPAQISQLLAKLVEPKAGDRICDPACGSGSLLLKVAEEIPSNDFALYGQDSNGGNWTLARMNMFLHGKDSSRLEWGDTLNNPQLVENDKLMKFNIVVANPPFSLDKWGAENAANDKYKRFNRGVPPKSKGDYAFISHMIETALKREGKVGVIVPHGVLFRGGAEGKIRQQLLEENLLDAVIGLPTNLFPSTSIPVAILIFDRAREEGGTKESRQDVLFIDASKEFQSGKAQNLLRNEDMEKIISTFKERKVIEKYSYLAKLDEIKENDYNLNIPRYVDTFEEEEEIDIVEVQKEIEKLEAELVDVRAKMDGYLKELGLI
jgi:type I restriction enzyme M protein